MLTLVQILFFERNTVQSIPYSQFVQLLNEHKVSDLRVEKDQISGKLQEPINGHPQFSTVRADPALAAELGRSGVGFTGVNENTVLNGLLSVLLPFVLIMVIWHFLFHGLAEKQGVGGLMSIGKSRVKVFVQRETGVTFADVAGIDEAKAELVEIVSFLTYLGERMPGPGEKDYSEQTAREVDLCIRALLDEAYGRARALLESRRADLDAGAHLLLEKETLTPEDFPALIPYRTCVSPGRNRSRPPEHNRAPGTGCARSCCPKACPSHGTGFCPSQ